MLHKEGALDQKKCGVCKNLGCDDGTLNEIEKNFYEKRRLELARNFYEEIDLMETK